MTTDWPTILAQTDKLIELTECKARTLCELRFSLAVAAQVGSPKEVRTTSRSEADLPPQVSPSSFRWPYLTPWKNMVTRVARTGSDQWQILDPFLDRRTGLPVEMKPARALR